MDNTTNTENQNLETTVNVDAQATEAPKAEDKPISMADVLAARNKQLQTSAVPNQRGITKDITLNAGTPQEYTLTLQYPGFAIASMIEDDSTRDGDIKLSLVLSNAVDNDVFVQPRIKSLDFWDTHKGGVDVAREVLSFLNDGIDGNLE